MPVPRSLAKSYAILSRSTEMQTLPSRMCCTKVSASRWFCSASVCATWTAPSGADEHRDKRLTAELATAVSVDAGIETRPVGQHIGRVEVFAGAEYP